jgi:formate hydrogenlyase subunit 3/multisubunit Na+/H+ antiporter MnhD subunit
MGTLELLLVLAPGLPVGLALLWPVPRLRRGLVAVAPWAALPALILALHPGVEGAAVHIPALFTGLHLGVDGIGRAFLLVTALLWVAAGTFARAYHARDPLRGAFFGFFVLTMAGNLGVVLAGDMLSFYLSFALMTFAAYGLVVHRRDEEARRAGRIYVVLAILGELCILMALFSLGWAFRGMPVFGEDMGTAWSALHEVGWAGGVAALVVAGFGVKAGLAPLHLWLPLAHPVAPTAASALLSGAMIKAGLLAWIRFLPGEPALPELGLVLAALGVASAFYGVVVGLAQDDPKTVLAYSSVSQMGYMAVGVGLLMQAPGWAPMGLLAVALYAVHHGVAKGALFLAVGVGDRAPGGPSRWPLLVTVVAALPALALAGAPLTSGARAKGALKGALRELEPGWYQTLDLVLLLAAVATTLLMVRFLATLRRRMAEGEEGHRNGAVTAPWGPAIPWLALVGIGALGGLWLPLAHRVPEGFDLPGLGSGLWGAAWPVLVGGGVGWAIWRRSALLGPLAGVRLPAGDLVVLCEWLFRQVRRLPWGILEEGKGQWVIDAVRRGQERGHEWAAWAAARDLHLARGPVVGVILLGVAVLLALVLAQG